MASYKTSGVCSRNIEFDVSTQGTVSHIRFQGGCNGSGQGIARLAEGRTVDEVIGLLSGIRCDGKPTSCPDQLAQALIAYRNERDTK